MNALEMTCICLKEIVDGMISRGEYGNRLNEYKSLLEELVTKKYLLTNK